MVKQYSQLYLEARRALLATEDQQSASLLARNLLCHVSGKTQEQVIADRDLYANEEVCQAMEQAVELRIPLRADCGSGTSWLEAH